MVEIKQEKEKIYSVAKRTKTIKIWKIKFVSLFIVLFMILSFFWYYITCFCGIYENTQTHLIKDSIISLLTSFIYPFALNLIPGIFRISALRAESPSRRYLYKFSNFLENLLG